MALSLLPLLIYSLLQTIALSAPHHLQSYQYQEHKHGLKSLHLTFYLHEITNKSIYFTVQGVKGPKNIAKTLLPYPFGSQFVFNDLLTETPDPSSKVLGYMKGSGVMSSFDGDETFSMCRTSLNFKGFKGDILNLGNGEFTKVSELPVVGGTKDFRFVQGYMITSLLDRSGVTSRYKIELHLYWPPYATLLH